MERTCGEGWVRLAHSARITVLQGRGDSPIREQGEKAVSKQGRKKRIWDGSGLPVLSLRPPELTILPVLRQHEDDFLVLALLHMNIGEGARWHPCAQALLLFPLSSLPSKLLRWKAPPSPIPVTPFPQPSALPAADHKKCFQGDEKNRACLGTL